MLLTGLVFVNPTGSTAEPTEETFPVDYNDTDADASTANTKSESKYALSEPERHIEQESLSCFCSSKPCLSQNVT